MSRDVVLLCLDTVRYDHFERYADDLRAAADQSFRECRTASTWSVPSHASMFTGTLPHVHGFHSATPAFDELDREETFLASLEDHTAVGVSANPYVSPVFGFDGLFDEFHHVESSMPYPNGLSPAEFWHETGAEGWQRYPKFLAACFAHDRPFASLANGAASQAAELFERLPVRKPFDDGCGRILSRVEQTLSDGDEPTFVFANLMDAHGPLADTRGYDRSLIGEEHHGAGASVDALGVNMDDRFDERSSELDAYRNLYAAAVEYTTRRVAEFCAAVDDDTVVVVTADHGEQLGEAEVAGERRFGHVTPDVTEALLHVPLAVVNGTLPVEESRPISHLDLGDLVVALATESEATFEPTTPPVAEVAGLGVAHPPTDHPDIDYWSRTSRCVYLDGVDQKWVWDSLGDATLFAREDGDYVVEESGDHSLLPAAARDPFSVDIERVRSGDDTSDLDGAVESQLEELGYL